MIFLMQFWFPGRVWGQAIKDYYKRGLEKYKLSDFRGALGQWERGLKLAEEMGNIRAKYGFLTNIGVVYENLGNYAKALSIYKDALKMKRKIGDKKSEGMALIDIGNVY